MKTVYLHIGTSRIEATSIRLFLANVEDAPAEREGISPRMGHLDPKWSN